ncbi:sulfite exporter TauE/SafE family protein [Algivirga pacifica]|uniref:Probable membrane transporter protein n=1 Tax=Algivirga pacifica TaxID=1162670 RepID=A0ABP9DKQ6_9BACT
MELLELTAYLSAGIAAGVVNTLAGGGSIFTLSLLLFMGVPAPLANGTNRLGILVQNISGAYTFHRSGLLNVKQSLIFIIPSLLGALTGAYIATDISTEHMEDIVGALMVFMLFSILIKPSTGNKRIQTLGQDLFRWYFIPLFYAIGFYGGFVQAGIGILIIVSLSLSASMPLIRSNAIKMLIIALYSLPVVLIFVFQGQILWLAAILLAIGQLSGTWITNRYLTKIEGIDKWIKWIMIVMISITIVKTFFL